ncbi:hypothetical protein [Tsukamurella sp. 1534]|uniref:hypothetical protein n=1 Tax=Tsukamurella sp. 1534 TaxID=1151061 RepID=UPI0002E8EC8C|nr:hypothetical protein [Tsukamurella sp. 1534]
MKHSRSAVPIGLLLAVALALTGCGGSGDDAAPAPSTMEATTAPTGAQQGTPGGAQGTVTRTVTAAPSGGAAAEDPADYRSGHGGVYFMTPTRNIACGLDSTVTGCQVFKTAVIPPGADCDHGTMPRDELSKGYVSEKGGPFTASCFNQGVFFQVSDQRTLPYGRSVTAGGMTCRSEEKGVTCTRGSHGFFVSAQSFDRW